MKRNNIIWVMLLIVSGIFIIQGCAKDDSTFTTHYTAAIPVATSPKVNEDHGTAFFTGNSITLSWEAGYKGTETLTWDLYFGTDADPELYEEGLTSTTKSVPVVDGETYHWYVEYIDANGIKTTSPVFEFTAVDGSNPMMDIELSWTTDVATSIGVKLDADKVADFRFIIAKESDNSVVEIVDESSYEVFSGMDALEDGTYVLGLDLFSAIDAGDLNKKVTINMGLNFSQLGIIDTTFSYPALMSSTDPACDSYRTNIAKITKTGSHYTVERIIENWIDPAAAEPAGLVGTWSGDDFGYDSEISADFVGGKLMITGIGRTWMFEDWGEVIQTELPVEAVYNGDGTFSISNQKIMTTTWKGDIQPDYYIEGTIYADFCGGPDFVIVYDFIQPDGAGGIAQYFKVDAIEASVTLDASTKKSFKLATQKVKPIR